MTTSNSYQKYKVELFAEIVNDWNYFCKKLHFQCLTVVRIHLCDYCQAEARFSTMLFPSKSDGRLYLIIAAPWWSGYHYCTTSFNKVWTQVLCRFQPTCSILEIQVGEDLWQRSWLEIRLNVFHWSIIPQKHHDDHHQT